MKLIELSVKNYRSIKSVDDFKITSFQSLIGENNCGKSNLLSAIETFLSAGSGGTKPEDFNDRAQKIIIKAKFKIVSIKLKKIWKPYLLNEELILEKHIWLEIDSKSQKETVKNEFHGYQAEPSEWFLSEKKIKAKLGERPKWKEIIDDVGLPTYFLENGISSSVIFKKALSRYLSENDIDYDAPDLSSTQALGFQSNVAASLPKFYLLKAITDYSDEIDKRSNNTTFRKLMADLSDRILKQDTDYQKIEKALHTIEELLNEKKASNPLAEERLTSIGLIENKIKGLLSRLMPSVEKVTLRVLTEDVKAIFSRGVEMTIDDGIETDVVLKGHGLQRCIVFSLIQTLILNERNELINSDPSKIEDNPIILAIEEPELYIHPQLGKLFYDVLKEFGLKQQVIYSTHSPRFIDVYENENIALIKKTKTDGTKVINCDTTAFDGLTDRKIFQGLTQLNTDVNELFFAKNVIVTEGPEDKIAITETSKKLNKIKIRTEELDITIVVANGKGNIPFFVRVLNAFKINYVVLHDSDIRPGMAVDAENSAKTANQKISDVTKSGKLVTFPIKLEDTVGYAQHFTDQYNTLNFFSNHSNINTDLENVINDVFNKIAK
jgi:putative ATP-dependent endonuclease of the OLD family